MSARTEQPIRLAIVNDYPIVVAGVAAMLADHADRVRVIALDVATVVTADVDVVLFDSFARHVEPNTQIDDLVASCAARIVVFTWTTDERAISRALASGAAGYLSKGLTAKEIVDAVEAVHLGEVVTSPRLGQDETPGYGDWPGRAAGLTPRESEIVALITRGLSNQEISQAAYIGINSIKSHIRSAYRKIGVQRRAQAVVWGVQNGFSTD